MTTTTKARYVELASIVQARLNCAKSGDHHEWYDRHEKHILDIMRNTAPSGSGIDNGTKIDLDASTGEKLVFTLGFHHMNDAGMYDGWTEHTVTVVPSLQFGFNLKISGRDRNGIKEYLHEVYGIWLGETVADTVPA